MNLTAYFATIAHASAATHVPASSNGIQRLYIIESGWAVFAAWTSFGVAIATLLLALFTYVLARETRESLRVARESVEAAQNALSAEERRHMDTFQPHLAINVRVVSNVLTGSDLIQVMLSNIGPGYARDVVVVTTNVGDNQNSHAFPAPNAFAPGSEFVLFEKLFGRPGEITGYKIIYHDAFGRTFESRTDEIISIGARYQWTMLDSLLSSH